MSQAAESFAQKASIEIPVPHSKKQRIIMRAFTTQGLQELWVASGSKFGKTLGGAAAITSAAALSQNSHYRWIAPIYSQAKIGFNYCKRMLPPPPYTIENKSDLSISVPGNETYIEFRSGKHPQDLEGAAVMGNALDEAAKMNADVYAAVKTTTTVTKGSIVGFSTPFGKNWFYKKCMEAKEEMEWALAKGIPPKKIFITAGSIDNPAVSDEAIEQAKANLPDRLFRQYYLAEFIDDGSVFIGFRSCFTTDEILLSGQYQTWLHEEHKEKHVVIGVDWAKHQDFTVMTAVDIEGDKPSVVGFLRFQNFNYTDAIKALVNFSRKFKKVGIVIHDKTGVGEVIDELLAQTDLTFEGLVFNNANKAELVSKLMVAFERKHISLPRISVIEEELDAFEVQTTTLGTMRYNAPAGLHDDTITSLMLGYSAALEYGSGMQVRYLEDLPKTNLSIDRYYRDMIDDDDDIYSMLGVDT